jgi:hypothetical protein
MDLFAVFFITPPETPNDLFKVITKTSQEFENTYRILSV